MMEPEEIKPDKFLKEILAENIISGPSSEFTANVIRAVEAEAAQRASLSAPLIPRQVWHRLGLAIGLILLFPFVIGLFTGTSWSDFIQDLTSFSLPKKLIMPASDSSSVISYLPRLGVITAICTIIFLVDKVYQQYQSK